MQNKVAGISRCGRWLCCGLLWVLAAQAGSQTLNDILDADMRAAVANANAAAAKAESEGLGRGEAGKAGASARRAVAPRASEYVLSSLYGVSGSRLVVLMIDGAKVVLRESDIGLSPPPVSMGKKQKAIKTPLRLLAIDGSCIALAGPSDAPRMLCFTAQSPYRVPGGDSGPVPGMALPRSGLPSGMPVAVSTQPLGASPDVPAAVAVPGHENGPGAVVGGVAK